MTEKRSVTLAREFIATCDAITNVINTHGATWKADADALEPKRVEQRRALFNAIHDEMRDEWPGFNRAYKTARDMRFAFSVERDRRYREALNAAELKGAT